MFSKDEEYDLDPILNIGQVKAVVSYSVSQIYRMIAAGTFPAAVRLGPGRVGWRKSSIRAWLNSRQAAA